MDKTELNVSLYRTIYFIRYTEEVIQREYHNDEMKTPMHMSMGSEAIVAGICSALRNKDQVLGTYRSHALYLAKTDESDLFFAELYGKETGVAHGKAGSMHLNSQEHGLLCCSAIVGSTISVATGVALANKMQNNDKIVVVFFGDGASETGTFWESFNFATANKLKIIYVLEKNGLIVHTDPNEITGYKDILEVANQYNCRTYQTKSTDVEEIHQLTHTILRDMNHQPAPALVSMEYHRYLEHVGIAEDYEDGYRDREAFDQWKMIDPIKIQRVKLIEFGHCTESDISNIESAVEEKVEASLRFAQESNFADASELYKGVFA